MHPRSFITVQRRSLDSWLWDMPAEQTKVALTLLLMANWIQGKTFSGGQEVVIERGQVMTSIKALSRRARVSERTARTSLKNLEKCDFLTCQTTSRYSMITIHNYEEHQAIVKADRQADRQAPDKPPPNDRQAGDKPPPNDCQAGDNDITIEPLNPGTSEPGKQKGGQKRACQIPDSWAPNLKHQAKATEDGVDLAEAVESFRDYHQAKGSAMKSWDAAFNTWLRNAKKFQDRDNHKQKPRGRAQETYDRSEAVREEDEAAEAAALAEAATGNDGPF